MISLQLNRQINFYLTSLLAFFAPIHPKILPILIGLITLNWILTPSNIIKSFKNLISNYTLLASVVLFLLYLIGMTYTQDMNFGWRVIETKLSLFILPVVYAAYFDHTKEKLNHYLKYFVWGCVVYALMCFVYATYAVITPVYTELYGVYYNLGLNYFYYDYLSLFIHPSYTAMYSVLALFVIVSGLKKNELSINKGLIFSILILVVFVFLLSSKAGWLALFLLMIYAVKLLWVSKRMKQVIYIAVPTLLIFLAVNVYLTPNMSERLPQWDSIVEAFTGKGNNNEVVTTGDDGNAARVFIWKTSFELFTDNFLIGVGTGDTKNELLKKYEAKGMATELKHKLNSHNQFLTTAVAIGILGLLTLLFLMFYPLILSIKQKEYIVSVFVLLYVFNCLFESAFETQAGLVFYAFFNTILCSTFVRNNSVNQ